MSGAGFEVLFVDACNDRFSIWVVVKKKSPLDRIFKEKNLISRSLHQSFSLSLDVSIVCSALRVHAIISVCLKCSLYLLIIFYEIINTVLYSFACMYYYSTVCCLYSEVNIACFISKTR